MTDTLAKPRILNARQEAFCQSYVRRASGTQAAKDAGYSAASAHAQGCRLLKDADILNRIETIRAERFRALHMGKDETLALIAKRSRFSLRGMVKLDGGVPVIDLENATDDQLDCLVEASMSETGVLKVKGPNVDASLNTMAKIHGLLKDKVEISVDEEFAGMMERAQRRAKEARNDD